MKFVMKTISDSWRNCKRCCLHRSRNKVVNWRGYHKARIILVGEAPGANEDEEGIPFVGKAGKALDDLLISAGLDPDNDVFVCNVLGCRPPNNRDPLPEEVKACKPRLQSILWAIKPLVIVLVGRIAARVVGGVNKIGIWKDEVIVTEFLEWKSEIVKIPSVVIYHPSYWIRNGRNSSIGDEIVRGISRAAEIAKR